MDGLSPGTVKSIKILPNSKLGKILIDKVTYPAGDNESFEFAPSYGPTFSLKDTDAANDGGFLAPGVYSVEELEVEGWDLTSVACDDGSPAAAIDLQPGEIVTCTFTNTKQFVIIPLVCHAGQVYLASAVVGNGAPVDSLTPVDWGSENYNPCSSTPLRFEKIAYGEFPITVSISVQP